MPPIITPATTIEAIRRAGDLYPEYAASGTYVGSPEYELDHVARGGRVILVARVADQVAGVVQVIIRTTDQAKLMAPDTALLQRLRVIPTFRRQGLGRALNLAAEDTARKAGLTKIGLLVEADNGAAIKLYRGLGYAFLRITKGQVSGREFLAYTKDLS